MFIGQSIGPFEIESELGSGAMGTVYKAKYDKDDKVVTVALKVVALGLLGNDGAMARFEREANILKQLRHPHITRLFATGKYKGTPFIAMEFVDGEPLDRVLARRGRLGWEEVATYGKHLCEALQYAHEKGIIHRDLKPSNLMITKAGVLKLTDFGIAKDQDVTALTGQNSTIGTAAYMSPEQCRGEKNLSNKSDLYSLGIVLFELITGKKPFTAENTVEMFLKHVNDRPPRPGRLVPDLPVWMENLVLHLLEKDREKRPLDAATVGRLLAEIEDKVQSQQSVGAAVANARRIDRPVGDTALTESDRDAARAMRAGKAGKKLKKKKATPFLQRGWVRAVPLVLVLLAILGGLYYAFKPAGRAEMLAAVTGAATPEEKIDAAKKYLARFESGDGVDQVRSALRETRGRQLEAILDKRAKLGKIKTAQEEEDPAAYEAAWTAIECEQKGDVARAADFWAKVHARALDANDKYADGWQWLADKHRIDIKFGDEYLKAIRRSLENFQAAESAWHFDAADPMVLATMAVRLGGAGGPPVVGDPARKPAPLPFLMDEAKTAKTWSDLADLTKDKSELRGWHLLALREKKKYSELKPEEVVKTSRSRVANQMQAIRTKWDGIKATTEDAVERRDCRNRCRDIVELYADETDDGIKASVAEAQKLLEMAK